MSATIHVRQARMAAIDPVPTHEIVARLKMADMGLDRLERDQVLRLCQAHMAEHGAEIGVDSDIYTLIDDVARLVDRERIEKAEAAIDQISTALNVDVGMLACDRHAPDQNAALIVGLVLGLSLAYGAEPGAR